MSEQADPRIFTMSEKSARSMLVNADEHLEISADLIYDKIAEDPLDMRVVSYLCDTFSCNYHIRRILKTNLGHNLIDDEETKEKLLVLSETDIMILENAVLSFALTKKELLKLNFSLSLH
tara:strand:+ start:938 stop:1297 length:360 start_codon:yes stop_codon:yes gene_type:complete